MLVHLFAVSLELFPDVERLPDVEGLVPVAKPKGTEANAEPVAAGNWLMRVIG
jgi:hypothetical protein